MLIIRIEMFEGRTIDDKPRIIKDITEGFCHATGAIPETVQVALQDISKEDWGRGGIAFADRPPT